MISGVRGMAAESKRAAKEAQEAEAQEQETQEDESPKAPLSISERARMTAHLDEVDNETKEEVKELSEE